MGILIYTVVVTFGGRYKARLYEIVCVNPTCLLRVHKCSVCFVVSTRQGDQSWHNRGNREQSQC